MDDWTVMYKGWDHKEQPLREALCTLGNGYFATRGAADEMQANGYNYPGTYLAGGYNRLKSEIAGREIENEDLVNWPNWIYLTFRHESEDAWFNLDQNKVSDYIQELHLDKGILERKIRFTDNKGRETSLLIRRLVSMHDYHVAAQEWTLIPENWSGEIVVRHGIDGSVINNGVERYRELNGKHVRVIGMGVNADSIFLTSLTSQSKISMTQSARVNVYQNNALVNPQRKVVRDEQRIDEDITLHCSKLEPVKLEKTVTLFTNKDLAISDPKTEALTKQKRLKFPDIFKAHQLAWSKIWFKNDIEIESDDSDQLVIRLHLFHLFQTISPNSMSLDVGVPSRGWHGEAYRGHIFWDELYVFPFLNLHIPQIARSMLLYRYRRLSEASYAARCEGYKGVMFPWQSGSNGREESQRIHLNPRSGNWIPDNSHRQRHINSAVVYNVWQYFQCTNDMEFLTSYGAEMILGVAQFWTSITKFNPKIDRYEIHGVMGPDEYHTKYPDSEAHGLNNNAYTNFMAVWVLTKALRILELFDDEFIENLMEKLEITAEDIEQWKQVARKMYIPFHNKKIINQFDGFDELDELDWNFFHEKYGHTLRLDRILEDQGDTPNRYRATKQADVLMLFYLFSSEEIIGIFESLGYDFKAEYIPENIAYHQKVTAHGSTLSQVIHSWVYARSDRQKSWKSFKKALMSDFKDVQGGTTPEGIHLGAMAGTIDLIQRCYTGLEIRDNVLWLHPKLPENIKRLKLNIRFRSHWIAIEITQSKMKVRFDQGWADPVRIGVHGRKYNFETDDERVFSIGK